MGLGGAAVRCGVASAVVLLNVAAWCMLRLVALRQPALGGLIFSGPGLGIALTGLSASAMVAWHWPAAAGWAVFGLLCVWGCVHWCGLVVQGSAAGGCCSQLAPVANHSGLGPRRGDAHASLWFGGLGYIVTATFLPVIARAALPAGSVWPDLFWPLFGMGVAMGAALSTRARQWRGMRRWLLLVAYLLQAAAIGLSLVWPGVGGFALGSWLLGLPFTAITFFGLQEARRVWPSAGTASPGCSPPLTVWADHRPPMSGLDAAPRRHAQPGLYPGAGGGCGDPGAGSGAVRGDGVALAVAGPLSSRGRRLYFVSASGRRSTKQAPPPAWSSQCTLPLCRRRWTRTSASPRPTPPERSLAPGRAVEGLKDAFALVQQHARTPVAHRTSVGRRCAATAR